MESLQQDIAYCVRGMLKNRGFTAVVVLVIGLGIGANTAMFTVADAALLRPLPYREPDRLVHLWEHLPRAEFTQREASYPDFLDWSERNDVFEEIGAYQPGQSYTLTGHDAPERLLGARVSSSFFATLGVGAAIGRTFLEGEDRPGAGRTVLLTHALWQRRFGADPAVVGRPLLLNGNTYTVAGVLPQAFQFAPSRSAELYVPLDPNENEATSRGNHWIKLVARLRPGVTFEQAASRMEALGRQYAEEHQASHAGAGIRLVPLRDEVVGQVRPVLLVLLASVGFVLLVACTNVANLLLARSSARRKELAVRVALGASRGRLIRQLLTESVMLALLGGAAGVVLASWGCSLLVAALPDAQLALMPYLRDLAVDWRALAVTGAASLVTGLVFGLAPAVAASKPDVYLALKAGAGATHGPARNRARDVLVVSELAIALVLLVGAGLMMKSFLNLLRVDLGFDPENLLTFQVSLPQTKYADPDKARAFHRELLERLGALPGVTGVATVSKLPLIGGTSSVFRVEGRPAPPPGEEYSANVRDVSPDYFRVMRVPLLAGRVFDERDTADAPTALVVNQTLAEKLFPGEDAIGRRLVFGVRNPVSIEIVGVVADERVAGLDKEPPPVLYGAYAQDPGPLMSAVVRTTSDPGDLTSALRREVGTIDPDLAVFAERTMEQFIADTPAVFVRRYPALLVGIFAAVALALAAVGIYGVVSYSVGQRTQEIGVRIALGARAGDVFGLVFRQGVALAAVGVAVGLAGAFTLARLMSGVLYGVSPFDPTVFTIVPALLFGVVLLACYVPARRATKVDPLVALRSE